MSAVVTPLHVGRAGGVPVRFFKGPSGQPELPWHAVDDLYRALGLPQAKRRFLLQVTQAQWSEDLRTVATAEGLVTIAPHYVAQGMIDAAVEAMGAPAEVEREYVRAGKEALEKLVGDLPPLASFEFVMRAFRNTHGTDGTP